MPIYEYKCKSCDTAFETLRAMRDAESAARCPTCQGEDTMRLLSRIAAPARSGDGEACDTSAFGGGPCCRTIAPGGG